MNLVELRKTMRDETKKRKIYSYSLSLERVNYFKNCQKKKRDFEET